LSHPTAALSHRERRQPAFVTPSVLSVLVEKFNIAPITTPEADLAAILG